MKNKRKGFTLIELLAVIVILGLLMAIAIPSVTKYITESRKKTVVSTIGNYITAMVNEVNDLTYTFTGTNTIYAVPIECISLERGGTSPFGAWHQSNDSYWAYVLVQYDDETSSYRYGYTFKDSAGYGLYPTAQSKLNEQGKQIKTGLDLSRPQTGKVTTITSVDKWSGFAVDGSTDLVVLEAASEGEVGDGKTTCTLCQKGNNYTQVEEEKANSKSEEESLNSYNFYYNRLYRTFIEEEGYYVGFVFRENNIVSMYMSEGEKFEAFEDGGDADMVSDLGISYDMLPVYNGDQLFFGFFEEGTKFSFQGIEFELTDIKLQYSIQYSLNGGTVSKGNPTKYNEKTKTFTLNNPTREGYNFAGWTYNGMTEPQKTVTITSGSWGNRTYTAKWEGKLSNLIRNDNVLITAKPTLTAASNQTSDASGLYASTDTNSGKVTYYFRGNVKNNYVKFAGQTWQIIRINEDGTIRLILNGKASNSTTRFNTEINDYSYMYYSNSDLAKPTVDSWYKTNITDKGYESYVATGTFCEQAKAKRNSNSTTGTGPMTSYSNYTPNFKCSPDDNGKGVLNLKVGLITYDELIHAGGYYGANTSYYLYNNSTWTMSSAGFSSYGQSYVWVIYKSGFVGDGLLNFRASSETDKVYLRPVINLNADVLATGTGTSSDPYVIQTK